MLLNAYALYDRKSLVYHSPFYQTTDGAAARALSDLVNDPQTTVARHPGDYVLYCVGSYDDQKGELLPLSPLRHVVDAQAFVKLQHNLPFAGHAPADEAGDDHQRPLPNGGHV